MKLGIAVFIYIIEPAVLDTSDYAGREDWCFVVFTFVSLWRIGCCDINATIVFIIIIIIINNTTIVFIIGAFLTVVTVIVVVIIFDVILTFTDL